MPTKARIARVQARWFSLPDSWRVELSSAFHTFAPAFVGAILLSPVVIGETSITRDAVAALALTAVRSGFKAVSVWFFSRTLPDPKE